MGVFRSTFALADDQMPYTKNGEGMSALRGNGAIGLTEMTTAGTSANVQSGGADFQAPNHGYVTLKCTTAVWVRVAAAPTAAVGSDFYLDANERIDLAVIPGDKIAVIDDS